MLLGKKYSATKLPSEFKRDGRFCYLDSYRKRLIEITPEETVRQRLAKFLEQGLNIPHDMMLIEVPLCWYEEGERGRADIVIHQIDEDDGAMYPVAVVECKAEEVAITDKTFEQAMWYANTIGASYIIVSNGIEIEIAKCSEEKGKYIVLERLLTYKELCNNVITPEKEISNTNKRLSFAELNNPSIVEDYNTNNVAWIFGQDTPDKLKPIIVNLYDAFMDTTHIVPKHENCYFEIIQDLGVRYLDYSNAGGGHYTGNYRSILVKDNGGNAQIISFSVFGTDSAFRNEHRKSYASLVVAIDRYKTSHNVLQYNVDKYVSVENENIYLYHDGKINAHKSNELMNFALENYPDLVNSDNRIFLGKIDYSHLMHADNPDFWGFVERLVEYALCREQFISINKKSNLI